MAATAIGLIAYGLMRESAPVRLSRASALAAGASPG
jgi:hypothetical protein